MLKPGDNVFGRGYVFNGTNLYIHTGEGPIIECWLKGGEVV
jgi:hypothetical protein